MKLSSWRNLWDKMLLSPKLNVVIIHPYREKHWHTMLTLYSFTSGVSEASDPAGRHQHDDFSARTSNRQHTTKSKRNMSAYKIYTNHGWSTGTHTAAESKRSEILKWVSNIPYTSHHKLISEGRLEGTGVWLLRREEYRTWRSSSTSKLLLLRGIRMSSRAFFN